nr:OB-fold nucleic acid binding domain-containing protein [Desulfuribacillus stibiiarsenatis]
MKTISQFQSGESVINYFLVKAASMKSASNQNKYLDVTLCDQTGDINAKLWDASEDFEAVFQPNALVKIKGTVTEWQGKLQLKIEKVRAVNDSDDVDIADFVPSAPHDPAFMYQEVMRYADQIVDQEIQSIVRIILEESKEKLLYYPAAQKNHHSIRGGLLFHVMTMLRTGERISEVYPIINKDLLYAGVILHDIAKLDEMAANHLGIVSDYTTEGHLLGHIIQGIKKVERIAKEINASVEKSLILQHMILSHHSIPEFGSPKPPMIPEAELLHYIDMIDSRMYDMEKALSNTENAKLSEKVWSLNNRRVYKTDF